MSTTQLESHRHPGAGQQSGAPGHPCPDPEGECSTADALLSTARALFAERGFEGTSVRAITEGAGANLAAVTYHFGSKQGLYQAVLQDLLGPVGAGIHEALDHSGPPLERIRRVVAALVRYMGSNPDYPRLLLQQIVASPLPHPVVQSAVRENLLMLQRLVEEGQADGSIREGDPLLMALSLISQPAHMSVVLRPVRHIMEIPEEAEAFLDRLSTHAADFAVRALEAREESP